MGDTPKSTVPVYDLRETRIDRLNETNWRRWHETIRGMLRTKQVWETVESKPASSPTARSADWNLRNEIAMTMIRQNVDNTQFDYISGIETAYTMWNTLTEIHQTTGGIRLTNLLLDFYGYGPKTESVISVSTHLSRLQAEIGELSREDKPTDRVKTIRLLIIFKDHDDMKAAVQNALNADKIEYNTVISRLREAQSLNWTTKDAGMRTTHSSGPEKSGNRSRGKKRSGNGSNKKNDTCDYCNKTGHWKTDCFTWLATDDGRKFVEERARSVKGKDRGSSASNGRDTDRANVSTDSDNEVKRDVAWRATDNRNKPTSKWIIDSAATSHMSYERSRFITFNQFDYEHTVTLGDGRTIIASGRGNVITKLKGHNHPGSRGLRPQDPNRFWDAGCKSSE
jgi:hypothetical protein